MSRSNWRQYFAIGGVVLALLGIGIIGWYGSSHYKNEHRTERSEVANGHAKAAGQKITAKCTTTGRSRSFSCVMNAPESEGADKAAEYDLKAQQEMAHWAFAMFLASAAGVAVTLAGVAYVALTLDETRNMVREAARTTKAANIAAREARKANRAFQEVSQRQLRAYVSVISAHIQDVRMGGRPTAHIILRNVGSTPANDLRVWTSISLVGKLAKAPTKIPTEDFPDVAKGSHGPGVDINTHARMDGPEMPLSLQYMQAIDKGEIGILVYGEAEYFDIFGDRQHTYFRMWHRGPDRRDTVLTADAEGNDAT